MIHSDGPDDCLHEHWTRSVGDRVCEYRNGYEFMGYMLIAHCSKCGERVQKWDGKVLEISYR